MTPESTSPLIAALRQAVIDGQAKDAAALTEDNFILADGQKHVVFTSAEDGSGLPVDSVSVYYVYDADSTAAVDVTVELVGTFDPPNDFFIPNFVA